MVRFALAGLGGAVFAGAASAAFLGIEIREDKNIPQAAIDAGLPADTRVFNFYSKHSTDEEADNLTNVGLRAGQNVLIELNTTLNPNAEIFNLSDFPNSDIGAPLDAGLLGNTPAAQLAQVESFVSIGLKSDPTGGTDGTTGDPDFGTGGFLTTSVVGGWFVTGLPSQGVPVFNSEKGEFEVFFMQLAVTGLEPGGTVFQGAPDDPSASENSHFDALSSIFLGNFDVFPQEAGVNPDQRTQIIIGEIPTPGALAVFGAAGLVAARRRRA